MSANANLQWGPNIRYNIYTQKYGEDLCDTIARIAAPDNDRTEFIKRNGIKYFTITLATRDRNKALKLHVRLDNLYITGISVGRGKIHVFSDFEKDFIGEDTVKMKFKGSYTYMTRKSGIEAYKLCYLKFQQAVETLISSLLSEKKNPHDWIRNLFIVLVATAEGSRNQIVRYGVNDSQMSKTPSSIPLIWVKMMINDWSKISKIASGYKGGVVLFDQLTPAEVDRMLAMNVIAGDYEKHLQLILEDSRLARALLTILLQASLSTTDRLSLLSIPT